MFSDILCCVCVCQHVFVLFSMLSHVRLTDSIESADSTRCVTIYLASLGGVVFKLCVRVCWVGRKVFDPSYL